jgi:predicted nucleic acid-binding protein
VAKLNIYNVYLETEELAGIEALGVIPREDLGVYLTASKGKSQCFVSANHKLIQLLAKETGEFECLTPQDFVEKYLRD